MSFYVHLTVRPCRCSAFQTGTLQAAIRKYPGVLMLSVERDGQGRERDGLQYSTGCIRNLKEMTKQAAFCVWSYFVVVSDKLLRDHKITSNDLKQMSKYQVTTMLLLVH